MLEWLYHSALQRKGYVGRNKPYLHARAWTGILEKIQESGLAFGLRAQVETQVFKSL